MTHAVNDSESSKDDPEPSQPAGLRISVVIPVYNEVATLEEVIRRVQSVQIQHEIVLVDDASTDGSRELLDKLSSKPGIRVFKHERNKGKGAFIARFSMDWSELGKPVSTSSGNFRVGSAKDIAIPGTAADIRLKIEIMTSRKPVETWKTVLTETSEVPMTEGYTLSGTTLGVKVAADA